MLKLSNHIKYLIIINIFVMIKLKRISFKKCNRKNYNVNLTTPPIIIGIKSQLQSVVFNK